MYNTNIYQNYTDYAKYIYDSESSIASNKEYKIVENKDIQKNVGCFDDFYNWMKADGRLDEYDFDIETLTLYYIHSNV